MPFYEYKCKKCGNKYEMKLGMFHTSNSVKCPKCGSHDAERVFSSVSTNTSSSAYKSCSSPRFR